MTDELSLDPALVQDFVVESEELLQRMDQDMVALEASPADAELLNRIFRAIHTIKGTSSFLHFDAIVRLSHRIEDGLNALRRGEAQLGRRGMDALLAGRDQLGIMLQDLRQGGLKQYQLEGLLEQLQSIQKTANPAVSAAAPTAAERTESSTPPRVEKDPGLREPSGQAAQPAEIAHSTAPTMRVEARKLDELINLIGELVLERNRLVQLSRDFSLGRFDSVTLDATLGQSSARMSFITDELQSAGLRTRMVPIETVFRRFPRLVRDIACNLKKEVQLLIRGEDTELDKTMVELISDPLVHLIRNSLDHGIETPETREKAGKPRRGTIRLEARQEGDQIVISISDDGAGINPEHVGRKAVEKGLVTAERLRLLCSKEVLDFIFLPGFSTVEKASDLSGRGVGMDVVRSNLKKLNGSIEIDTQTGLGTTILLRLPLTLAILPVLLVQVSDEVYALPLRSVIETAQGNLRHVHQVEGREVLRLRNETLPLVRLGELFHCRRSIAGRLADKKDPAHKIVVLAIAERRVALLVDALLGQESTVVKPLGNYLHGCTSLAGATISGDGRVRLVLDPVGLLAASQSLPSSHTEVPA